MNAQQNGTQTWQIALAWLFVGIPLAWGVFKTLQAASALFN